ncbi:hypothetical protein Aph01nite_11020 [Acrocarpospora phusangensis]|uniref:Intradiol ring-cleavage dioxygenases domain-containing protein n=1 Tax=Acrocarpospora phusangensis TaxID=1070424 RepID=A0A919Q5R0_9ACTN|nr:hypothetical protein Aph01nite_11020 [Acrocarpospora phusangensis]
MSTAKISAQQQAREEELTERVVRSFDACADPRLRELMAGLVRHLHAYIREVRLTEAEWAQAIDFLTRCGHITSGKRQEFILLSDTLGASMQTIAVNNEAYGEATEATVVGPFFVEGSPEVPLGGDISNGAAGEPCWVEGSVRDTEGRPLPGVLLEVWEADEDGHYDVQYGDDRTAARGHLYTGDDGEYRFWGITPTPYPIPRRAGRRDAPSGGTIPDAGLASALQGRPRGLPHPGDPHLRPGGRAPRLRRRLRRQGVTRPALRPAADRHAGPRRETTRRHLVEGPLRHRPRPRQPMIRPGIRAAAAQSPEKKVG